ncbi:ATP-binding protein [bacterium]|nr:ATP-binding protein [bacterium]
MPQEYLDLKVPSNPKLLRLVRRTVAAACEVMGFDPREINAITLAVDESCTNIIRHCGGGGYHGDILVRLRMLPDRLVVTIRDYGGAIDLARLNDCLEQHRRELQDQRSVRPGGLGVMLIHSVMDRVRYRTNQDRGTVLRLVKYLGKRKGD